MIILFSFLKAIKKSQYFNILRYDKYTKEYNYIENFYCLTYKDLVFDYEIPEKDSFYIMKKIKEYYSLDIFLKNINQKKYVINLLEKNYYSLEKLKNARLNYLIKYCNIEENDAKFILQLLKN